MLLAGRSASATVSHLSERHGVTRRQAQRYVAAAYKIIRDDLEKAGVNRIEQVAKMVHMLEEGAAKALETKNIGAMVAACRELRELCALTPLPQRRL